LSVRKRLKCAILASVFSVIFVVSASILLSGIACTSTLSAVGAKSYGPDPFGVSSPSGKQWTMTFDDEFTQDASINTNKWNGGAGGTDWCGLDFHGKTGGAYMFAETNDPCGQHYEGCTLSHTNGLSSFQELDAAPRP